jgi:chemotaxis protein MotB
MADKRPIIIIKKVSGHGGHHGGAWKVAYADFVTAMMALFIVLWLTSSGEKVKKSIASYFNDPQGTAKEVGTGKDGTGDSIPLDKKGISELKEKMERQIASRPDLKKLHNQVDIIITPEGMRIELMESKNGTFFESGSAVVNSLGKELLALLAQELSTAPNRVSIEGHTDAQQYQGTAKKYDNWDLSTDRANAARRVMQASGLQPGQLAQVRGFADQQLRVPSDPMDPSNRRVSVIVHFLGFTQTAPGAKPGIQLPGPDKAGNLKVAADAAHASGKTAEKTEGTSEEPAAIPVGNPAPAVAGNAKPSAAKGFLHNLPTAHDAVQWVETKTDSLMHHKAKAETAPASKGEAPAGAEASPK